MKKSFTYWDLFAHIRTELLLMNPQNLLITMSRKDVEEAWYPVTVDLDLSLPVFFELKLTLMVEHVIPDSAVTVVTGKAMAVRRRREDGEKTALSDIAYSA